MLMKTDDFRVCVLGLGYVGLPLAVALGKHFRLVGLDINSRKIESLKNGVDPMNEIPRKDLKATRISYTTDPAEMRKSNFIIAAVPTPITKANIPDLSPIEKASEAIGKNLVRGSIVVFESTVYPGVTEEIAVPIIEKLSGLKCGIDWKVGYSPERINPGDKEHTIHSVVKVVSGMDKDSLEKVAFVYGQITKVHRAESIKVAEAAKIIENIQRDLNIALMNELSLIFERMGIDLNQVLCAAGTKWNFHKYKPGLVGGHCIGVDPYYLTHKAQELGYQPKVILAGRQINDGMAKHVAELTIKGLNKLGKVIRGSRVLILGLTFKENVKDARNSKTRDVIHELQEYGVDVIACDPNLDQHEVDAEEFNVKNIPLKNVGKVDGIILTVPHKEFMVMKLADYAKLYHDGKLLVDVKGCLDMEEARKLGFTYIRL
jgi:UDP-N-acetyl-D-glucosamine/UDP-N-acetyl-D-galactosamine dehydrogenase